jgi:hypothetical protein
VEEISMYLHRALFASVFFPCLLIVGAIVTSVERDQDAEASTIQSGGGDQTSERHRGKDTLWQKSSMSSMSRIENTEAEKLTDDELRTAVRDLVRHVRILEERVSQLENPPVKIIPVQRR